MLIEMVIALEYQIVRTVLVLLKSKLIIVGSFALAVYPGLLGRYFFRFRLRLSALQLAGVVSHPRERTASTMLKSGFPAGLSDGRQRSRHRRKHVEWIADFASHSLVVHKVEPLVMIDGPLQLRSELVKKKC